MQKSYIYPKKSKHNTHWHRIELTHTHTQKNIFTQTDGINVKSRKRGNVTKRWKNIRNDSLCYCAVFWWRWHIVRNLKLCRFYSFEASTPFSTNNGCCNGSLYTTRNTVLHLSTRLHFRQKRTIRPSNSWCRISVRKY